MGIQQQINQSIRNGNVIFVFPDQVIAENFLDNTLKQLARNRQIVALPTERFIAWDSFKAQKFFHESTNKSPVSSIERQLFAADLLSENQMHPFLNHIISPKYSEFSSGFSTWLAGILPELVLLSENDLHGDKVCSDFVAIKRRYEKFLELNGLFEASAQDAVTAKCDKKFLLFGCDLMNDWLQFRPKFDNEVEIALTLQNLWGQRGGPEALEFSNSRDEISFVVSEVNKITQREDFPQVAITVNDDALIPYLTRELEFYDIPYNLQKGRPLGKSGAGQLFSLIQNAVSQRFSLSSMKALFLNEEIPWGNRQRQDILTKIENSVKYKNYFEQSFFRDFLQKFRNAKSFIQLRNAYFTFRDEFFHENLQDFSFFSHEIDDPEGKNDFFRQANNILSRCVNELTDLDARCNRINLRPENYLEFFVEYLNTKIYRPQRKTAGVHIFDYKSAMLSPFSKHFVLNCTQNGVNAEIQPFAFLGDAVRERLERENPIFASADLTKCFIYAYDLPNDDNADSVIFTYGQKTFSGDDCMHPFFSPKKGGQGEKTEKAVTTNLIPENDAISPCYKNLPKEGHLGKIQDSCKISKGNLVGKFKTSASGLNSYAQCPHKWLFERIFKIDDYSTEIADLIEPKDDGSFKHLLIEYFLKNLIIPGEKPGKIVSIPLSQRKNAEKMAINAAFAELEACKKAEEEYKSRRDTFYRQNLRVEFTEKYPEGHEIFKTLNEVELILSQRREYEIFMSRFAEKFFTEYGNFAIFSAEMAFGHSATNDFQKLEDEDIYLHGRIDCVLLLEENNFGIIDFKRASSPSIKSCVVDKNGSLPTNFQMAVYDALITRCYKNSAVSLVDFFELKDNKVNSIMRSEPCKAKNENQFKNGKDVFRLFSHQFKKDVENGDFTASTEYIIDQKTCQDCSFKYICRTCYSLTTENPPNNYDKSFLGKLNFQEGDENG